MPYPAVFVLAVSTGVVVIVVAVAIVLVVLLVTSSMRGGQKRSAQRRGETQRHVDEADQRAAQAEHQRDVAQQGRGDDREPDR